GNSRPLDDDVRARLINGLRAHPTTRVFLAYDGDEAVGVAVCFMGYSTFAAKPLINIHDLAVLPEYRGRGIGRSLLNAVEEYARAEGCCKVTLEVFESNHRARKTYAAAGFGAPVYGDGEERTLFLSKSLA
ncbi:MAG TPA: GNAT family N-acetyltransferase, partial [Rhodothermales bacterium]